MKYVCLFPNAAVEKEFEKALLKIPHVNLRESIRLAVEHLAGDPRPFGTKPFKRLQPPIGFYGFTANYRVRVGDYRVLYDVDDGRRIVWILALRKRDDRTYKNR